MDLSTPWTFVCWQEIDNELYNQYAAWSVMAKSMVIVRIWHVDYLDDDS